MGWSWLWTVGDTGTKRDGDGARGREFRLTHSGEVSLVLRSGGMTHTERNLYPCLFDQDGRGRVRGSIQ